MDGASLVRARWRLRGAWLWPAFAATIVFDAVIGHALPPAGETQSVPSAALVGLVFNLLGVLLLRRPLGALIRRARPDLPAVVARDYAGTFVVIAVSAALLATGLAHRSTIVAHQNAMREATARAEAWIGMRAPATFRRNVQQLDVFEIQAGSVYRACAPSDGGSRTYCVIVNVQRPWADSVRFSGYEPNSVFSQGVG
jgi:hypothetical protein